MILNKDEGYIKFITTESNQQQIDLWFKYHNIIYEKLELYYDFTISLLEIVEKTYLGSDILKNDVDMKNHFKWCFNETVKNFEKEKISFKSEGSHFDYFWLFFLDAYYLNLDENKFLIIKDFFNNLFDFSNKKIKIELEMVTDLYKILDQNLKKQ